MRHMQHPSNNDVLGAPPGVPIEECGALPITRVEYAGGLPAVVSFWRPSPDELAALNRGDPVFLSIMGRTHAPLYVGVGEP